MAKKLNTELFIKKSVQIHGDKYSYKNSVYVNVRTKILITCKEHGDFLQKPSAHMSGSGCLACGNKYKPKKQPKYDGKWFVQKATEAHGDKYDYSKVEYHSLRSKVLIICATHGGFWQEPKHHLNGCGCQKCKGQKNSFSQRQTKEAFVEKAKSIFGKRFSYHNVKYTNLKTPVEIVCKNHGSFFQQPDNHLQGKVGCMHCSLEQRSETNRMHLQEFINRGRAIHGNKYSYAKVSFLNLNDKVIITCPIHGDFKQHAHSHIKGTAPSCCGKKTFNPNEPAILYYLRVCIGTDKLLYKIGITNHSVEERYLWSDLEKITVIREFLFSLGSDARMFEKMVIRLFSRLKYNGPKVLDSGGNTELFVSDVLGLDNDNL